MTPPLLDHVILAVRDLDAAAAAHAVLLGRAPSWRGAHATLGTRNVLFRLDDTYLELLAPGATDGPLAQLVSARLGRREERAFGLALGVPDVARAVAEARGRGLAVTDPAPGQGSDDASGRVRTWRSAVVEPASARGLLVLLIEHTSPADALPPATLLGDAPSTVSTVDHVVVFTQDLDASVALWRDRFGLAVTWQRDFPERGTRNVGLDLGGVTLELIVRTDRPPSAREDVLWGVAHRVADLGAAVARVRAAGGAIDDPRPGLAPGTRVATVRWQRTASLLTEGRLVGGLEIGAGDGAG